METTWTIEQYQTLSEAIALGATRVEYQDKEVEYRSLSQMLALKRLMERELGISSGARKAFYPIYRDGTK